MAGSLAARMARLEANDMLSTDMAADLVGTTRVTINAWIAKGAGAVAAALAGVNIFGGFLVTQRMLAMYKKKDRPKA